jgi:putative Mg2+ transporter-C (MgtC) family protein
MQWELELRIIGEVAAAMMLGGLIGLERELAHKPAGFRTHMLVAGAAALLMGLSDVLVEHYRDSGAAVQMDPTRVLEAVVTGISFLGAGTIFLRRNEQGEDGHPGVEGLTTAASILLSAALGLCVGLGELFLAGGVTALALIVLSLLRRLERRLRQRGRAEHPELLSVSAPPAEDETSGRP